MRKILLHVGMPKAGSTSLQNNVFMALHQRGDIVFVGRNTWGMQHNPSADLIRDLRGQNSDEFDRDLPRHRQALLSLVEQYDPAKTVVLSEEALLLTCFNHRWRDEPSGGDFREVCRRLSELLSDFEVTVFLVLRSQLSAIYSLYAQFFEDIAERMPDAGFDDFLAEGLDQGDRGYLSIFHYDVLASCFAEKFGEHNLEIVLFEELRQADSQALSRVDRILGLDTGVVSGLMRGGGALNVKRADAGGYRIRAKASRGAVARGVVAVADVLKVGNALRRIHGRGNPLTEALIQALTLRRNRVIATQSEPASARIEADFAAVNRRLSDNLNLALIEMGYPLD